MLHKKIVEAIFLVGCISASGQALAFAPLETQAQSLVGADLRPSYGATDAWLNVRASTDGQLVTASYSPAPSIPDVQTDYGIFGSVALPIATLPAAKKWDRASSGAFGCDVSGCKSGIGRRFQNAISMASSMPTYEALSLINNSVNNLIRYRSDRADVWATPAETLASGAGDCEDIAIAKMSMLREMGYAPNQLQLVVLRNKKSGTFHAVLVVHVADSRYVLDNLSNRVLQDAMFKSYAPIQSFVGDRVFIHGFKSRTVVSASLEP